MTWLSRKWAWAREKPLVWANLGLVAVVVLLTFVYRAPDAGDFRIRALGMVLQLIGVATVWRDLTATGRHFGKPGFLRSASEWLKAGLFGRNIVVAVGTASGVAMAGRMRAKVRTPIRPDAPISDRVSALEALSTQIDSSLDEAYREIDRAVADLEGKAKAESAERVRAVDEVKRSLESTATGNYNVLAFGAAWLAVGIVLATLAPEIAKAVAGQWASLWKAL